MTTNTESALRTITILLVEDNPADAELAVIGLSKGRLPNTVHIAQDGKEAMSFLLKQGQHGDAPTPDLILLDLNLPGMDGREVLMNIKSSADLRAIPVVMLTTSRAAPDIDAAYSNHVNAYMTKPVDIRKFHESMVGLLDYWFDIVELPSAGVR